ncbi:hypothetical protein PFICI_14422 [Pestalotiopsis fici W106-1]|uniref:Protoporphyrinogen oxidase n=1 Tax=Pestalotiopsis fici (strain W106-1 / CGMCC3.15140) TaxID=1229662 RepID=W3WKY3_PESFW|nr:uncharacterized protein PFICI_14422 [Pestalotiopsis fici W106-1]ETS73476.1 hypothetical protein PFICI_14422 [Pestalotiopsis fici W106-1]
MTAFIVQSCCRNTHPLRAETFMRLPDLSHWSVRLLCLATRRHASSRNIAVIGGGITGLATTYFAAQRFPSASITLFEASSRLGGAIESTRVTARMPNADHGIQFLCERGPRTLRANADRASVTYEIINSLGLASEVLTVPSSSRVAENRYIMYPRHLVGLPAFNSSVIRRNMASVPAPSTLGLRRLVRYAWLIATEPLFSHLVSGVFRDMMTARRPQGLDDDSIGQFVTRRWGHHFTNNFMSAIIHGLYAGDIDNLSMKALMPRMWRLEEQAEQRRKDLGPLLGFGGVLRAMLAKGKTQKARCQPRGVERQSPVIDDCSTPFGAPFGLNVDLQKSLCDASVFSFRNGIQSLTLALYKSLQQLPNVRIRTNERVVHIESGAHKIRTESEKSTHYDCVVATIALKQLIKLLPDQQDFSNIETPAATVMVVTLCYGKSQINSPYRGFGYLVPRSVPLHWNPEKALGIIFDSDAMPGQDIGPSTGTKITVIFGGHWWVGKSESQLPSERQGISMAQSVLQRHLHITEDPVLALAKLSIDVIPQYTVGHCERMSDLHSCLLDHFHGRLRVAGNSYRGIGVHDCIFSAKELVENLGTQHLTGLECFHARSTK